MNRFWTITKLRPPELSPEEQVALGFGLATPEFIASAGRDTQLLDAEGFDQGMAILWLIGWKNVDGDAMRRGLQRLLTPACDEDNDQLSS